MDTELKRVFWVGVGIAIGYLLFSSTAQQERKEAHKTKRFKDGRKPRPTENEGLHVLGKKA